MINEIEDVLSRKKLAKYLVFSVSEYLFQINSVCIYIEITLRYNEAPDKDDNYLYDLCIDTESVLVTGDKLLLLYVSKPPIQTISRFDFLNSYN